MDLAASLAEEVEDLVAVRVDRIGYEADLGGQSLSNVANQRQQGEVLGWVVHEEAALPIGDVLAARRPHLQFDSAEDVHLVVRVQVEMECH